jgi:hypothetical protein
MGVGTELLGQQVRCPHCQQVVLAPAPAFAATVTFPPSPPPPPPIEVKSPPPADEHEHESIFGEVIDDDLFGRPVKPLLEVPPEVPPPVPPAPAPGLSPGMPNLELQPTFIQMPAGPEMQPALVPAPVPVPAAYPQLLEGGADAAAHAMTATFAPQVPADGAFATPTSDWPATGANVPAVETDQDLPPISVPRSPTMRQPASSTAMMYVWLCLVPYAIFMTIIAGVLYYKQSTAPDPANKLLEQMPDVVGDRPGAQPAKDKKKTQRSTIIHDRTPPDRPLPENAVVGLGETKRLGDLEVTPESVERKKVVYRERDRNLLPQTETRDSLVLHVTLKNVSNDWCWYPTDPAFERTWNEKKNVVTDKPYMFLDLVDKKEPENRRFYGSAFDWPQIKQGGIAPRKEYVEGQEEHEKLLCPGEEMKTVFFTNPADDIPEHLATYNGKLIWRIHLRRGVIKLNDRLVSTTGVVGVKFSKDEIK